MEKPPSKAEVVYDLFLGDAKELLADMKTALERAAEVQKSVSEAGDSLAATVEAAKAELVAAHRDLTNAVRETETRHGQALDKMDRQAGKILADMQRRTVWVATICAAGGGLIGGAAGALFFSRLLGTS